MININNTNLLRFFGILLIVNSHLDKMYPIQAMGTGGTIGNSIFFMLSSYGLYKSITDTSFTEWYAKRIKRIYPTVWTTLVLIIFPLSIVNGNFEIQQILKYLGWFFYPPFWFLQAIMFFYILIWFVIKDSTLKTLYFFIVITLIAYIIMYLYNFETLSQSYIIDNVPFCIPFYFLVMIFGVVLSIYEDKIKSSGLWDFIIIVVLITLLYWHKFLMNMGQYHSLQFFQQLIILPILYLFIKILKSEIIKRVMASNKVKKMVVFVSSITLEIYLVHSSLKNLFIDFSLKFPINIILFLFVSLTLSYYVSKLTRQWTSCIYEKK